jgi:type IV secretion system protein VirB6
VGFFATFWSWLNGQTATYIGDNTARLAAVLEPAFMTFATIYVMVWGYLHLVGKIDEPLVAGLKRILIMALILGCGLRLWLYNTLIVDTFYHGPAQLAAAMLGGADPVATIDTIWDRGGTVAGNLWQKGHVGFNFGFLLAALVVWGFMGALCVYAMFLIALSNIALAILLALGPLFIGFLFFDATRRFFSAWMAQLANYALITLLTVMAAALLLQVVQSYAAQTAARGAAVLTVDALNMILIAVLVFLVLRQIMPIASGLAGGVSMNSFGFLSRGASGALRYATRKSEKKKEVAEYAASNSARSLRRTWSVLAQSSGRYVYNRVATGAAALGRNWRNRRR